MYGIISVITLFNIYINIYISNYVYIFIYFKLVLTYKVMKFNNTFLPVEYVFLLGYWYLYYYNIYIYIRICTCARVYYITEKYIINIT